MTLLDEPEYERWRQAAGEALRGAQAQRDVALPHWACFLAEQAAQLAVKGLLRAVGGPGYGHDLPSLGAQLVDALGAELPPDLLAALSRLSRHYIAARYPDAHHAGTPGGHYTAADADAGLADARTVLAYVERAWEQLRRATGGSTPPG